LIKRHLRQCTCTGENELLLRLLRCTGYSRLCSLYQRTRTVHAYVPFARMSRDPGPYRGSSTSIVSSTHSSTYRRTRDVRERRTYVLGDAWRVGRMVARRRTGRRRRTTPQDYSHHCRSCSAMISRMSTSLASCRHTLTPTSPSNSPTAIQGVLPMCR
jgi:hypothetical protein